MSDNKSECKLSCAQCASPSCQLGDGKYSDFCVSKNMDEAVKAEAVSEYKDEELKIMQVAAQVECDGYGGKTRVVEIMDFAKRMRYKKIGIATCVGLLSESRTFALILQAHGFEVFGIGCKAGEVKKQQLGIPEWCNATGENICNPILQAKMLEKEGTDLNVVVGLCVGHDSLFYKHSHTVTTTLITKDRVTGHCPANTLYTSTWYNKGIYTDERWDYDEK